MAFELGTAFLKVLPDLKGFQQQVGKSINAKKLARGAAIAGGAIAVGLAVGAKKAIDKASDLNEAMTATDATFLRSSKKVQQWSKDTNDAFSRTEFLGAAKNFGVFARAAKLGDDASAEFSRGLITAAGDMTSFHNADPSEVLQNLKSGLTGEAEPLRKYGILINEAAVNTEALASGIVKAKVDTPALREAQERASIAAQKYGEAVRKNGENSTEARGALLTYEKAQSAATEASKGQVPELTESQKILARRELIMKQLGPAEGDWANTIESAANQEKLQNANSEDLQATLGQGLLPTYQRLLAIGIKIVAWLSEHTTVAKALFVGLGILAGGLLALALALKIATIANTLFNVSIGLTAGIVFGVILALVALGVGLVLLWKKSETFRRIVTGAWEGIRAAAETAWSWIRDHVPPIFRFIWDKFIKWLPVIAFIRHFGKIKEAIVGAWTWVSTRTSSIWHGILRTVQGFVNKIIEILNYIPGVDIGQVNLVGAGPVSGPVGERRSGFARGGLVQPRQGGVYRVAEAGKPEMVIPLDERHRHRATKLLVETAERLGLVTDYQLGGLVDIAKGAGKAVGGAALRRIPGVGALLTARDLLPRLPSIPQVPAWIRGVFRWLLDKASGVIRRRAPRVGGSLVEIGRQLLSMGYQVYGHPAFGGPTPGVHTPTSWHYKGRAIDVNWPGGGSAEMAALDRLFAMLRKIPHLELLWRVADHFDHLHFAMQRGGPVRANAPYLVGEGGPELFVPGTSGQIVPNHELRQGGYAIVDLERARVWVQEVAEASVAGTARLTRQRSRMGPALGVST